MAVDRTTGAGFYVLFSGWIAFALLAILVYWRRICEWVERRVFPPPPRRTVHAPPPTVRVLPSAAELRRIERGGER